MKGRRTWTTTSLFYLLQWMLQLKFHAQTNNMFESFCSLSLIEYFRKSCWQANSADLDMTEGANLYFDQDLPKLVFKVEVEELSQPAPDEEEDFRPMFKNENTFENITQPPVLGNFNTQDLGGFPGAVYNCSPLRDYDHFKYVFRCLGPTVHHLKYQSKKLQTRGKFLPLLIKLHSNKDTSRRHIIPKEEGAILPLWHHPIHHRLRFQDMA